MTGIHRSLGVSRLLGRPSLALDAVAALAGQAANSVTNLALSIALAASMTIEEFGRFSAVFAIVLLAQGVARASLAEPLVERLAPGRFVAFPVLAVAAVAAGATAAVAVAAQVGDLGVALALPVALGAGAAAVHEPTRTVLNLQGRTVPAAAADLAWLVFGVLQAVVLVAVGLDLTTALVVAWAGGAVAAAVASSAALEAALTLAPEGSGGRRCGPGRRAPVYLAEFLVGPGFYHVLPTILLAVLGPLAAGQLRLLQLLQAPVLLAVNSLRSPIGGRLARLGRASRLTEVAHEVRRMLLVVVAASVAWLVGAVGFVRATGLAVTDVELLAAGITLAAFAVVAVVAADRRWRGDARLAMAIRLAQSCSFLGLLALTGSLAASLAGFGAVGVGLGLWSRTHSFTSTSVRTRHRNNRHRNNRHRNNRHGGNKHAVRQL